MASSADGITAILSEITAILISLIYNVHLVTRSLYEEEFPKQISCAVLLRSFCGVFVCAARGRAQHNKITLRMYTYYTLAAREIARLPVRTLTIMQSSTPVSCQWSANGHESRRAHVRLNVPTWEPYATQLPSPLHSRTTKDSQIIWPR